MSASDGGPAFPRHYSEDRSRLDSGGYGTRYFHDAQQGMSLRDWFAGQALTGLVADFWGDGKTADLARDAYKLADAMIAARNQSS